MEHTTNYNLPQWEASDRVTRGDMNDAMSAIDTALGALGDKPYVTGSYRGTGDYGTYHRNTLEFDFLPRLIFICGGDGTSPVTAGFLCYPCLLGNASGQILNVLWSETGVTWFATTSAAAQLNSNANYYYIAFK